MRFLTLAEALVIAEAVTGSSTHTLHSATRIELLDSALHAPQAGFGDEDFHPSPFEKAAVLCVRLARNHPLPDGNKRLAWTATVTFLAINGIELAVDPDDAVEFMLGVAAGVDSRIDRRSASLRVDRDTRRPTDLVISLRG